jgi:hypothetical protein
MVAVMVGRSSPGTTSASTIPHTADAARVNTPRAMPFSPLMSTMEGTITMSFTPTKGRVSPLAGPEGLDQFVFSYPQPMLKLALAVGVIATGLSVLGIATLVPVWRERTWPIGRRLRHSASVALFIALVATLLQWNAIGFRYY